MLDASGGAPIVCCWAGTPVQHPKKASEAPAIRKAGPFMCFTAIHQTGEAIIAKRPRIALRLPSVHLCVAGSRADVSRFAMRVQETTGGTALKDITRRWCGSSESPN